MGWLFLHECKTKKDLVNHLLKDIGEPFKVVDHATTGQGNRGTLYILLRDDTGFRPDTIMVCLLENDPRNPGWGYKDMDETMYPYNFDCPKRILDKVGPTNNEEALRWRAACKEYAATHHKPQVGYVAIPHEGVLLDGKQVGASKIVSVRPLLIEVDGVKVRVTKQHLAKILPP